MRAGSGTVAVLRVAAKIPRLRFGLAVLSHTSPKRKRGMLKTTTWPGGTH
jgi:hypothetical protein